MPRYALLILPAFNRVYGQSSARLTRAELAVFSDRALTATVSDIEESRIGGVPYVTFERAAAGRAGRGAAGQPLLGLRPVRARGRAPALLAMRPLDRLDSDLITIQKYAGKTNEQFTKLLLNVTAAGLGLRTC